MTVLKTVEVPQLQFIVGLGMHQIETVQKTVEVLQLQIVDYLDQVVDISVVLQRQFPMVLSGNHRNSPVAVH